MIKEILQDIIAHASTLDIPNIKVINSDTETTLEAITKNKDVVVYATIRDKVPEFYGTFGLPNLDILNTHLKCPEYAENAKIEVVEETRDGITAPGTLHFENESGDFINDYRFMNMKIINEAFESLDFLVSNWNFEFSPEVQSIAKLKYQSLAKSDEPQFQIYSKDNLLMCGFGDPTSHGGNFVFHTLTPGEKLKYTWSFPVQSVLQILALAGNKTIKISDSGAMQITVDSGVAEYRYILPAHQK